MTPEKRLSVLIHEDGTETTCPKCGKILNAATGMGDYSPRPRDVTVCIGCEGLLQYTEELHLEVLPDQRWAEMDPEEKEEIRHAIEMVRAVKKLKN